jgi:hypothetical protein
MWVGCGEGFCGEGTVTSSNKTGNATHRTINRTYLGNKHESLPNHERGKDNHGQVKNLKCKLSLVGPKLFQLDHLFVNHVLNHCAVVYCLYQDLSVCVRAFVYDYWIAIESATSEE